MMIMMVIMMMMVSVRESSKKGLQLYKSEFNDDAVGDVVVDDDDHDGHDDSQRIQ